MRIASSLVAVVLALALAGCTEEVRVGAILGAADGWPRRGGGDGDELAWSVAVDASGDAYVVGTFQGRADFGLGPVDAVGPNDVFIARYAPAGATRWVRTYGGSFFTFAEHVETSGGRVRTLGYFRGTMTTPLGTLVSEPSQALLILAHDTDGGLITQTHFPAPFNVQGKAFSRAGGNLALGGNYVGNVDLGTGPLGETRPLFDFGLLAMLDPSDPPTVRWSRSIAGDDVFANGVVANDDGSVVGAGYFDGVLELGPGFAASGGGDGWAARFDAAGAATWTTHLATSGSGDLSAAAPSGGGDVVVSGTFGGTADFGGQALANAGGEDGLVARLDADGVVRWAIPIGGAGNDALVSVVADGSGGAIACGYFADTLVAGGTLTSAGGTDALVVALDAAGGVRFVRAFGGPGNDECRAVAWDAGSGEVVIVGPFSDTASFGGAETSSAGGTDFYVHRFAF